MVATSYSENPSFYSKNTIPESVNFNGFRGLDAHVLSNPENINQRLFTLTFIGVSFNRWQLGKIWDSNISGPRANSDTTLKRDIIANLQAGGIAQFQINRTISLLFSPLANFRITGRPSASLNYWAGLQLDVLKQKMMLGISHANIAGVNGYPMNDLISKRGHRMSMFVDFSFGL